MVVVGLRSRMFRKSGVLLLAAFTIAAWGCGSESPAAPTTVTPAPTPAPSPAPTPAPTPAPSPAPQPPPPASSRLASIAVNPSFVGGQSTDGTVTLDADAPSGGLTIALRSDNAAAAVPGSVTVAQGSRSAMFVVATTPVLVTTDVVLTAQLADVVRTVPMRLRVDPAKVSPPVSKYTITFSNLSVQAQPIVDYRENGFIIVPTTASWVAAVGPARTFVQFVGNPGGTTTGELRVTNGGAPFWFYKLDAYSSVTPIPYVFEGYLSGERMFTTVGTLPGTFGNFAEANNLYPNLPIDTLFIRLSNTFANNPMGVDNLVVGR